MAKQSIEKCLADYTDKELIAFHANLTAIHLCCDEEFKIFGLMLEVLVAIQLRETPETKHYIERLTKLLQDAD